MLTIILPQPPAPKEDKAKDYYGEHLSKCGACCSQSLQGDPSTKIWKLKM